MGEPLSPPPSAGSGLPDPLSAASSAQESHSAGCLRWTPRSGGPGLRRGLWDVQSGSCLITHTCQSTGPSLNSAPYQPPCLPSKHYQKTRCLEEVPMLTKVEMILEESKTVQ